VAWVSWVVFLSCFARRPSEYQAAKLALKTFPAATSLELAIAICELIQATAAAGCTACSFTEFFT